MTSRYENPLSTRYSSSEMQFIFSDDNKFATWRALWVALAESQSELGLDISDDQISQMKEKLFDINYESAAKYEIETRHDVMSHILAFGEQCPDAKSIIHLGATSSFVGDNTDILQQRAALLRIKKMLVNAVAKLRDFAIEYKGLPCLAYTHFQPAQPTTVGKRAALWIQDLLFDIEQLDFTLGNLKLLGCRGTTGTSASFIALFNGNHDKAKALEEKIAEKMGLPKLYSVNGQTYSRKVDYYSLSVLSGIAQSAYKFSNDIRLLSHLQEVEEPFEDTQIGSSAMAYKRNPMRSERIAALARYVTVNTLNPALTASAQWLERSLDDSANRRLSIPEAFLATDAILALMINITDGLTVFPKVIESHLIQELPFMATENILMHCVKKGGDRQLLHDSLRKHSFEAALKMKQEGGANDLTERILADGSFDITIDEMEALLNAQSFTGRAKEQVEEYMEEVKILLNANIELLGMEVAIVV